MKKVYVTPKAITQGLELNGFLCASPECPINPLDATQEAWVETDETTITFEKDF